MNAVILQRLIWKEYRFLRSFWVATLLLAIAASVSAIWLGHLLTWRSLSGEDFFMIATIASCLYSLGVGAMSFATEHELSTNDFLRRLPLDANHLLVSKVAASMLSLVGLKLVLWFVASLFWMITAGHLDVNSVRSIWLCGILVELEFFALGSLCSLLSRQPLLAIIWGVGIHSAMIHVLLPNLWPIPHQPTGILQGYAAAVPGRLICVVLLLAAVAVLSEKWIRSAEPLSLAPAWLRRFSMGRRAQQGHWLATEVRATMRGQLGRLIWLQWRQSRTLWGALSVPCVFSGVWLCFQQTFSDDLKFLFVASTGILLLGLGVSVFHGEQVRNRFRFFAERGVTPSRVWWGHQLALLVPLLLVTTGYLLVLSRDVLTRVEPANRPLESAKLIWSVFGGVVAIFTTAQLAGMLFRNALVASAAALVALLVQSVWLAIVVAWSWSDGDFGLVPISAGFLPLPLSWLWISRWYAGHWILERQSRAVRGWLCAWFFAPWLLCACGIMAFRVLEIPGFGVEPPTRQELLTLNDEERQTATVYQSVREAVGLSAQDSVIAERLRESDKWIEDLMLASRRPTGALAGDLRQQRQTVDVLFQVLTVAENQAGDAKDFERSLEICSTAMRILEHWRHSGSCLDSQTSPDYERRALDLLRQRLTTATLTAEQYREAARRVASWDHQFRAYPRNYGWSYREALDHLRSEWWRQAEVSSGWEGYRVRERTWLRWIPGEQARARRLLRLEYAIALAEPWRGEIQELGGQPIYWLMTQSRKLRWNTPVVPALIGDVTVHGELFNTTEQLLQVPISARKRLLQTWLELQALRAEQGEWPPTLESLQNQDPSGDWIEYRPHGVLGMKSSKPMAVRGLNAQWSGFFFLQGDEPCLVYFRQAKNRIPLPDALLDKAVEDMDQERERRARSLTVELLDRPTMEP